MGGCRRQQPSTAPPVFRPMIEVAHDVEMPRPIYPYSIVPGGIRSKEELQKAIATDPAVAAHYANFDVRAIKPVTLSRDASAFVSFRKNGKVYWTSRRVTLKAGEQVFQGGEIAVRGRCGNQVSDQPRGPVTDDGAGEPDSRTFNTPGPAPEVVANESTRTAVAAKMPVAMLEAGHQERPPAPAGNLGWSTPLGGAASGGGAVASGGGGGGGGTGGGSGTSGTSPPGSIGTVQNTGAPATPAASQTPATVFLAGPQVASANTVTYAYGSALPGSPVNWFQPAPAEVRIAPAATVPSPVLPGSSPNLPSQPGTSTSIGPVQLLPPTSPVPPPPSPAGPVPGMDLPEPSSWALLLSGAVFVAWKRKKFGTRKI